MISNCPVCDSDARREVMTVSDVPGFCNVLYDTADEAAAAPRGDIDLVMCEDCGLLYNASFDEALQCRQQQCFSLGIQRRGRFVENKNGCVLQQRPRDG